MKTPDIPQKDDEIYKLWDKYDFYIAYRFSDGIAKRAYNEIDRLKEIIASLRQRNNDDRV